MNDFPPIVHLAPVAEAGFPDIISPVIFTPLCNFKCRYCLNTDVVKNTIEKRWSFEEICEYMEKHEEEYILISGGEPCIHSNIENLVSALHEKGYKVRISTNGSYPEKIRGMIDKGILSFVAQDIKTSPSKIGLFRELIANEKHAPSVKEKLLESIQMLNELVGHETFTFEFRTTLDPRYVKEEDIREIASFIHPESIWFLQQFRARKGLLGGDHMADVNPYDDDTLDSFLKIARSVVPNAFMRWP